MAWAARAALPDRPLHGGGRPSPLPQLADVVGPGRARARKRPDESRLPARSSGAAGGAHRARLGRLGSSWGLCGPVWLERKWSKSPSLRGSPNPSDRGPAGFAARSLSLLRTQCVRAPQWPGPREWNGRRGPRRRASARPVKGTGEPRGSPFFLLQARTTPLGESRYRPGSAWAVLSLFCDLGFPARCRL